MTALTVAEVLRRAADVLDQRGWCQGDYGAVAVWNDAPNRTASEVKAALLAAAEKASEP